MSDLTYLATSLQQLTAITKQSYNPKIRQVALDFWAKNLHVDNPQWRYVTAKPFYVADADGSAHVMALYDKRLPDICYVGYFACTDAATGANVLTQATQWLKKQGYEHAYGPINGTLPNDYRLNLKDDFCFPGEPVNPLWHIDAFKDAGFEVFNNYISAYSKYYQMVMKFVPNRPARKHRGITIRAFDNDQYERDFAIYHDLRNQIFPLQSIYCAAISLDERIYNSSGKFDEHYTYFLMDNDVEVGFVMAYIYGKQLILKTIGLLPDYHGKKLSGLLLKKVHDQAHTEGAKRAIYGMVRVGNRAYNRKPLGVKEFRNYVTMRKVL